MFHVLNNWNSFQSHPVVVQVHVTSTLFNFCKTEIRKHNKSIIFILSCFLSQSNQSLSVLRAFSKRRCVPFLWIHAFLFYTYPWQLAILPPFVAIVLCIVLPSIRMFPVCNDSNDDHAGLRWMHVSVRMCVIERVALLACGTQRELETEAAEQ